MVVPRRETFKGPLAGVAQKPPDAIGGDIVPVLRDRLRALEESFERALIDDLVPPGVTPVVRAAERLLEHGSRRKPPALVETVLEPDIPGNRSCDLRLGIEAIDIVKEVLQGLASSPNLLGRELEPAGEVLRLDVGVVVDGIEEVLSKIARRPVPLQEELGVPTEALEDFMKDLFPLLVPRRFLPMMPDGLEGHLGGEARLRLEPAQVRPA